MHASVTIRVTPDDVLRMYKLAESLGFKVISHGSGVSFHFPENTRKKDGSVTSRQAYSVPEALAYLDGVKEYTECNGSPWPSKD